MSSTLDPKTLPLPSLSDAKTLPDGTSQALPGRGPHYSAAPVLGTTMPSVAPPPVESSPFATTLAPSNAFFPVDPLPPSADDETFATRYDERELLGEGGMGEVRLYRDRRIGRDVALKAIRPGHGSRSDLRARFVREARVQGQLEHPAIVPVYDLSLRPEPAFFTMKRVRGVTLEHVVERLRAKDPETVQKYSRRKLLTAFTSVCLAVDYAHAHGVLHRDLKPANVMLGDFGEVYVLDWGVAKVGDAKEETAAVAFEEGTREAKTAAGAVMGTLGYMSPEQLKGTDVDARADVYGLGAVLFEILALEPLHKGAKVSEVVTSTLTGAEVRAAVRAPDAPPELEAIWTKAVALSPADRFDRARHVSEAIERFLDGDRDLERRREMADKHAQTAAEAAERAASSRGKEAHAHRSAALRELGRALALDPTHDAALRTTLALRMQPTRDLPAEARQEILEANHTAILSTARVGALIYASCILFLPLMLWMGVKDWGLMVAAYAPLMLAALLTYGTRRETSMSRIVVIATVSSLGFSIFSRLLGPFVCLPAVVLANTTAFALDASRLRRTLAIVMGFSSLAVPMLLECCGVLSPSYIWKDGAMTIVPHMVALPRVPTVVFLFAITLAPVVISSLFIGRMRVALEAAQRRQVLQAWQLRQLVPDAVQSAVNNPLAITGANPCVIERALG